MSNTWTYTAFFNSYVKPSSLVESLIKILIQSNFVFQQNLNYPIVVTTPSGLLEFQETSLMTEFLANQGGYVESFKKMAGSFTNITLGTEFDFIHDIFGEPIQNPKIYAVKFMLADFHFRADEPKRVSIAREIEKLFFNFCVAQRALYGCALDNYNLDLFWPRFESLPQLIEYKEKPPLIFWLNYFSNDYLKSAPKILKSLRNMRARKKNITTGIGIYLTRYPWQLETTSLYDANRLWVE